VQQTLLIPGLLCDARLWAAQIRGLSELTCARVVDIRAPASIGAMAEAVLREAPVEFALGGFSMGGCVALEVVALAPQRVRRLALLSTNAAGLLPQVRQHYLQAIAGLEAGGLESYLTDAFPRYVAAANVHNENLREAFFAMGRDLGAAVGVRQMQALLSYPGFQGELERIACPTMLICGEEDQRTPVAIHRAMAARIVGAQLSLISNSGHFTPLEQPAAVTRAMRSWLQMPPR
jgi:pimeloyl-ACP methyl ester carboxylesterase